MYAGAKPCIVTLGLLVWDHDTQNDNSEARDKQQVVITTHLYITGKYAFTMYMYIYMYMHKHWQLSVTKQIVFRLNNFSEMVLRALHQNRVQVPVRL